MFKSLGGLGNITSIISNLQHIGPKMQQVAEEMRNRRITASAGDGAVQVTINGIGEVQELIVIREARDHSHLEIWIIEATNTAGVTAKQMYAEAISQVASDLNLNMPGFDSILGSLPGRN
jgi:DNA-binding protein YbaB